MSDITESEWQLIRSVFGDIAYEEPHNNVDMLAAAMAILDRAPDVAPDPGDETAE
ncbi:hypothetical protein [Agrobacterium tumefaciens]|uniref:hypothetical protein n=1 Tax=Agrobacterium tumefaciens TaxID=358 RepID=UPI00165FB1D2|nr:hypothetical protein [Agrobacterium tumefaciens]